MDLPQWSFEEALFGKLAQLLVPDGLARLHSIGRQSGSVVTGAWIRKYILPGGRFCRPREFDLIASEFSLRYGRHRVCQLQLTRDVEAVPICRDCMTEAESALEAAPGAAN